MRLLLIANTLLIGIGLCEERECASNICLNGGSCFVDDVGRRFACRCPPGFSGSLCQEACTLECANGVCVKGAFGKEQCQCTQGWSGELCEVSGSSLEGCTKTEDCGIGERCVENDHGLKICTGDPCESRPCKNNATCEVDKDSFRCVCPLGFAGRLCDADVNECELMPCHHGGTCINLEGSFECLCEMKYSGSRCENEGATCASNPCLNQGTCIDTQNGFYCICPHGFEGKTCQNESRDITLDEILKRIQESQSCVCSPDFGGIQKSVSACKCPNPLHVCTLVNGKPTCSCPQGFGGPNCTKAISGCDAQPCHNGGKCRAVPGGFRCYCTPDYGGETCDAAIQCLVDGSPCLNGGRCIRGLSENHCECSGNVSGRHCEQKLVTTTTGPCDSNPCLNGGTCHVDGDFATCECPKGFAGENCSNPTSSSTCDPNPCQNGGKCQNVGDPSEDGVLCNCPSGFEGNFCEHPVSEWSSSVEEITISPPMAPTTEGALARTTSLVTSVSTITTPIGSEEVTSCLSCVYSDKCVESASGALCICRPGYQGPQCDKRGEPCDDITCARSLICKPLIGIGEVRTSCGCPIGFTGSKCQQSNIVSFEENSLFIHQSPSIMIGSSSGPIPYKFTFSMKTTVPSVHVASGENIFGQKLFSIALNDGHLLVTIQGTSYRKLVPYKINDGNWYTMRMEKNEQDVVISVVNEDGYQLVLQSLPRQTSFDVFATRFGKIADSEYYVGCVADFTLGDSEIDLAASSRGTGIISGCKHTEQCLKNPCLNGGSCVDLWTHSTCICPPPFLSPLCMHSLPPSTFGHNNQTSFAEIQIPSAISQNLRFTTNIQFILRSNRANGSVLFLGEAGDELATFTSVSLKDGHVLVRSRAGGKAVHELKSHKIVNDNKDHIIQVNRQRRHVRLEIDGQLDSEGTIPSRFDHPVFVEKLQLGSGRSASKDAFTTDADFKGSLQDIRVNDKSVALHQQPTFMVDLLGEVKKSENVLEGSISDDVCAVQNQCVHGTCHNTFNDFECRCQNGFYGRICEKKDHCASGPCPVGGECKNVGDGYICTSPVTLKKTSALAFKMSDPTETSSKVTFSIRTHSHDGHVLTLESEQSSIRLSLANGQLLVTGSAPIPIRKTIADGEWHTIELDGSVLYVDSASYGLPPMAQLPARIWSGSLRFGAVEDLSFEGCLKDVSVGDLPPLSFYEEEKSGQPMNITHWVVEKRLKVATTCLSSPQCGRYSPCIRGECRDLWNAFTCECPHGFEGSLCEVNTDDCVRKDCGRGCCLDGIGEARCQCDPGFTGEFCDAEVDMCATMPCKNGALCSTINGTFDCECRDGFMGKTCEIKEQNKCSNDVCRNGGTCKDGGRTGISCICQSGFYGKFCEEREDPCGNRPCKHGHCKSKATEFECDCEEGYEGETCSELVDKCTVSTCSDRGKCTPVWNGTMCSCDKLWRGPKCDLRIDECLSIPCENDGTCESTDDGFKCHCRKYYLGERCEMLGSCLKSPCERGECLQLTHDNHSCSCPKGYEGSKCEIRINYCKKNPCLNGGTCESLLGEHKCHCISGFTGVNCETDIDECQLGYCANGATCKDRVADYDCNCEGTGFTGKNCTVDINECASSSSCIHGVCTNTQGGYRCDCELGYIGRRCSVRDPCRPDAYNRTTHTCVHGKCINPGVKEDELGHETSVHECKCNRGYSGPQCSTLISERKVLSISYIVGPMVAVISVLTILGCTLLAFVLRGKRALHGHYSPSHQERNGARMQMNSMIKLPPEERLI